MSTTSLGSSIDSDSVEGSEVIGFDVKTVMFDSPSLPQQFLVTLGGRNSAGLVDVLERSLNP